MGIIIRIQGNVRMGASIPPRLHTVNHFGDPCLGGYGNGHKENKDQCYQIS